MTSHAQSVPAGTSSTDAATVAIVGLGEVGRTYGSALHRAGHPVRGYDAYNADPVDGVTVTDSLAAAVRDADFVLVLTAAAASPGVAEEALDHLKERAVYVDLTSSAPSAKKLLAERVADRRPDVTVIDVAILGPVISLGVRTPLMAAGDRAECIAELTSSFGCSVTVVDGAPGSAMAHKLLRSVFMKSLAAAITESVTAGRAVGFEDWIRDQISRELAGDGHATIDRMLEGSVTHAARRADEMTAAAGYLDELGVDNTMSTAAADHLRGLAAR